MAPLRDEADHRSSLMEAREVENHYCPNCKRTEKFRLSESLECVRCGKRLHYRDRDERR